jgi:hypothetical protein
MKQNESLSRFDRPHSESLVFRPIRLIIQHQYVIARGEDVHRWAPMDNPPARALRFHLQVLFYCRQGTGVGFRRN